MGYALRVADALSRCKTEFPAQETLCSTFIIPGWIRSGQTGKLATKRNVSMTSAAPTSSPKMPVESYPGLQISRKCQIALDGTKKRPWTHNRSRRPTGAAGDPGTTTTLTHVLDMKGNSPNKTIADVMDIAGNFLCYEYIEPSSAVNGV